MLGAIRARSEACVIVEDLAANLAPAKALGMTTMLVTPNGRAPRLWVDVVLLDLAGLSAALYNRVKELTTQRPLWRVLLDMQGSESALLTEVECFALLEFLAENLAAGCDPQRLQPLIGRCLAQIPPNGSDMFTHLLKVAKDNAWRGNAGSCRRLSHRCAGERRALSLPRVLWDQVCPGDRRSHRALGGEDGFLCALMWR
ncbi:MAG: hypothetical protein V3S14_10065 [Anaerolineae bacterium]